MTAVGRKMDGRNRLGSVLLLVLLAAPIPLLQAIGQSPASAPSGQPHARQAVFNPDFAIVDLQRSTTDLVDGRPVTFFAKVVNLALTNIADVRVRFTLDSAPLGEQIVTVAEGVATASVTWIAIAGPHDLRIDVEPVIPEGGVAPLDPNLENNRWIDEVSVPAPDLVVTGLEFLPNDPIEGEPLLVTVRAKNGGAATTRDVTLSLDADGSRMQEKVVAGIAANGETVLVGRVAAKGGTSLWTASVDPERRVHERDETNNVLRTLLRVPLPDLRIDNLSLAGSPTAVAGETRDVTILLGNGGNRTTRPIEVTLLDNGLPVATTSLEGMAANASKLLRMPWQVEGGLHVLRADVDAAALVPERNESNNRAILRVPVGVPDPVLSNVTLSPLFPVDGGIITITAILTNDGADLLGPVEVVVTVDGVLIMTGTVAQLKRGERHSIAFNLTVETGDHVVGVEVDPAQMHTVRERLGVSRSLRLSVPAADLQVGDVTTTGLLSDGRTATANASVTNLGATTLRTFAVSLLEDGVAVATVTIPGLRANTTLPLTFQWIATGGRSLLAVAADSSGALRDTDRSNNVRTTWVDATLPQLTVADLFWTPTTAKSGDIVTLTTVVRNSGGRTDRPFLVAFLVNGSPVIATTLPGLAAGATSTVSSAWTAMNTTIVAMVDREGVVPESREDDNTRSRPFPGNASLPLSGGPDLRIASTEILPRDAVDGEEVTLLIELEDKGSRPAAIGTRTDVTALVDGAFAGRGSAVLIAGTGRTTVSWLAVPGDHRIVVRVDPARSVAEENETNNVVEFGFIIAAVDLSLRSLQWSPAGPVDGSSVVFFAEVRADGNATTRRSIGVSFFADGTTIGSTVVGGMGPGGNATASVAWSATPGVHDIRAILDPAWVLPQRDRSLHVIQRQVSIGAPSLNASFWRLPTGAEAGQAVRIDLRAENEGAITARPSSVLLLIDGERRPISPVPPLLADGVFTTTLEFPVDAGMIDVALVLDAQGQWREATERGVVSLGAIPVGAPDLQAENLTAAMRGDGFEGLITTVFRDAANGSVAGSEVLLSVDGEPLTVKRLSALPGNASTGLLFTWTPEPGRHILRATADPGGIRRETNETNNDIWLELPEVVAPELAVASLETAGTPVDGGSIRIFARIRNDGGPTERPIMVDFSIDGLTIESVRTTGLPAGNTTTVSALWIASPGNHTLRATVDRGDVVTESDEADNVLTDTLSVDFPDPVVVDIQGFDGPTRLGAVGTIRNKGAATLRPFVVTLSTADLTVASVTVPGLPADGTAVVTGLIPKPATGGPVVTLEIDGPRVLAEGDELNNRFQEPLPLNATPAGLPNLRVKGVHWVPEKPLDGERTLLVAEFESAIAAFNTTAVQILLDRTPVASVSLPFLPNGSFSVGVMVTATGLPGHLVQGIIDPLKSVRESNEKDNAGPNETWRVDTPTIEVMHIDPAVSLPADGERASYAVTIRNSGSTTLQAFPVELSAEGVGTDRAEIRGLPQNGTSTILLGAVIEPGGTQLRAWADPTGILGAADLGSSRAFRDIDASWPDLTVTDVRVIARNLTATWVTATVENTGGPSVRPVAIGIVADPLDAEPPTASELNGIPAGITTVSWSIPRQTRPFSTVRITADVDDSIHELNEQNNGRLEAEGGNATPVGDPVDVRFLRLRFNQSLVVGPPSGSGNSYDIAVTVQNTGNRSVEQLEVLFLADGDQQEGGVLPILTPNATAVVTLRYPAAAARHLIKVLVDPGRHLAELNETDDEGFLTIPENSPPHATLVTPGRTRENVTRSKVNERVDFLGIGTDSDGKVVRYEWDLDCDGRYESNKTVGTFSHVYRKVGLYVACLRVTDDKGATGVNRISITVTRAETKAPLPTNLAFALVVSLIIGAWLAYALYPRFLDWNRARDARLKEGEAVAAESQAEQAEVYRQGVQAKAASSLRAGQAPGRPAGRPPAPAGRPRPGEAGGRPPPR